MRYLVALILLTPLMMLARPVGPAQADHECGHFLEGSTVRAGAIESAALQGCAIQASRVAVSGDLSLAETIFPRSVDFSGSTFFNDANFSSATFTEPADFSNATFIGAADFNSAEFEAAALFFGAAFEGAATFSGTEFEGAARFDGATFRNDAFFSNAQFAVRTSFALAEFHGDAEFSNANFTDDALFFDVQFNGNVRLSGTEFNRAAAFAQTTFAGLASFSATAAHLDFRDANFGDEMTFGGDVGRLDLDGALFGGDLTFSFQHSHEEISAPAGITGVTNLTWNDVKDSLAPGDRTEVLRAWESFFASGGQPESARQIRTIIARDELLGKSWLVAGTAVAAVPAFAIVYALAFWLLGEARGRLFWLKVFGLSMSVMLPIGGAWAYDWNRQFPIKTPVVRALTSLQSLLGWLLLAAGSALAVIWFTA